jgi:hypothetical protein
MRTLLIALLLTPLGALGQSGFTGTWRYETQSAQVAEKDSYLLQNGVYRCSSCVPKIEVKADGQDRKVADSPYFDAVSIKVVDDSSVEIVCKKAGKITRIQKLNVLPGGKELTVDWTFVAENGQEGTAKVTSTRVSSGPAGAHMISGTWQPEKVDSASGNVLTVSYKATDTELSMTDQMGDSYTAKFDGRDYAYKGDPGITSVSLKKIDANTIVETDKHNGMVTTVLTMKLAPDGKTMAVSIEDELENAAEKWTARKQ